MININTLIKGSEVLGITLGEKEIKRFLLYKELLLEWNNKINITSIVDDIEIDIKHFIDSITLLSTGLFRENIKIIDVGTGGGFPGLPLKIVNECMEIALLDSQRKRIDFLKHLINLLGLDDVYPIHGRAEDFGKDIKHRENYDIAVSRAVASLATLCEYCLPFVKVGGYFISMKGPNVDEELNQAGNAIKILGGKLEYIKTITLPQSDIIHNLIIIKKINEISAKYPRMGNKPKKKPL